MTDIISYFPVTSIIKEPRPAQTQLFKQTTELIKSGSKKIIVVAPTGVGKGAYALTIMNWFNSECIPRDEPDYKSMVCSPLNSLVQQYEKSFYEIGLKTLRGRAHYPCKAHNMTKQCDEGFCQSETCPYEDDIQRNRTTKEKEDIDRSKCGKKPYPQCNGCVCWGCIYREVKRQYMISPISNTNFTLYSFNIHNNPHLTIIDESEMLEGTIRNDITVIIKEQWGKQVWSDYLLLLNEYYKELELESLDSKGKPILKTIRKMNSVHKIIQDYTEHKEEWNVRVMENSVIFEPITVTRFIEPLFKDKTVILMSATPEILPGWDVLEVDSEFPPWSVPWEFKPLGKMTLQKGKYEGSSRQKTIPKICDFMVGNLEGKTLVHCFSYNTALKIADFLRSNYGVYALMQTRENHNIFDDNNNISRYEIINAFKKSKDKNQIALTVNMGRGIDCPEPEICNNVIACLPQENPTDSLVKAKIRLMGTSWIDKKKAVDVMQADSRIKRGILSYPDVIKVNPSLKWLPNQDGLVIKKGWILDSNWNNMSCHSWFDNNKSLFRTWFLNREVKNG